MIEKLWIDGFRGMDGLRLDALGQFNVVVGPGNSGKTNLLEAVMVFCSNGNAMLLNDVLRLRRVSPQELSPDRMIEHLNWFWTVGREKPFFEIGGTWNGTERRNRIQRLAKGDVIPFRKEAVAEGMDEHERHLEESLAAVQLDTTNGDATYSGRMYIKEKTIEVRGDPIPDVRELFMAFAAHGTSGDLVRIWDIVLDCREEDRVIGLLRFFDTGIESVRVSSDKQGRAYLRVHHKTLGRMPLEHLGAGVGKALAITEYLVNARNGVLIIDEFDASLHVGIQQDIIEFVMQAAKRHNVQLFVSTHSLETLDAFLDQYHSASDLWSSPKDLRVLQMKREGGRTEVINSDADEARRLREEIGLDLRRSG